MFKVGDVVNNYRILDLDCGRQHRKIILKCICNTCNINIIYRTQYELNKHAPRCKVCREKEINSHINKTYNRLTVLEYVGKHNRAPIYKCRCSCGTIRNFSIYDLLSGNTSSCGCYYQEKIVTHNMSNERIYKIYGGMLNRCYNPNFISYPDYGGRGIKISDDWRNDFMNFYNDMGESYEEHVLIHGEKNTSIDRIDNDGDYCKENCKWSTMKEQASNRRNTVYINIYGRLYTLMDISNIYNIPYYSVRNMYYNNTLYKLLEQYYESKYITRNKNNKINVIRFI